MQPADEPTELYNRFQITRPHFIRDEHWASIELEADRLWRSLENDDGGQALGDIKSLVESIARITLDIAGTPAKPNDSFDTVVKRAHECLAHQRGHELANQSVFGQMATQASKIATKLGPIRNEYGGGHGRSQPPELCDEMVALALDGGLLWARWALRRLGYFAESRPGPLIHSLVNAQFASSGKFRTGDLKRRLDSTNLRNLEADDQRAIGVAVGQRVRRGTNVVRWEGLDPCIESDDLENWPAAYRIGLACGLWFDPDGKLTLDIDSLREALRVLEPVDDIADDLADWVQRIEERRAPGGLSDDKDESLEAERFVTRWLVHRPKPEQLHLHRLAQNIQP